MLQIIGGLLLLMGVAALDNYKDLFVRDENGTCSFINIYSYDKSKIKCGKGCISYKTEVCAAFRINALRCEHCMVCPQQTTMEDFLPSSDMPVYRRKFRSFDTLFSKALSIYIPFDESNAGNIPAVGTTVTGTGTPGPQLVAGKYGNAIYLPNKLSPFDNMLNLGSHAHHCADNWMLCKQGWTLAFWYKIPQFPPFGLAVLVRANYFTVRSYYDAFSHQVDITFTMYDPALSITSVSTKYPYKHGDWLHVAMTLDGSLTVVLYVNGCLRALKDAGITALPPNMMYMGCTGPGYCGLLVYDDLYIWEETKPAWFIWKLCQA